MHERVRFERRVAAVCHIGHVGRWVGTREDADRIDGSALGFHRLRTCDRAVCDRRFKGVAACRLSIGEEDDDLRGIGTRIAKNGVSRLHAQIRSCGAGCLQLVHSGLQATQGIGQAASPICVTRVGDETDAVLLVRVAHFCIRLNRLVDEPVDRLLERIHARVFSRQIPPAVELRMRGVTVGGGCFRSHIMRASCVVVPAVC